MADAADLKSAARESMRVRLPPALLEHNIWDKSAKKYYRLWQRLFTNERVAFLSSNSAEDFVKTESQYLRTKSTAVVVRSCAIPGALYRGLEMLRRM